MQKLLFPKWMVNSIMDIDFVKLKEMGILGLLLDIDNTLVANFSKDPDERVHEFIKLAVQNGMKLCILSNASLKRVEVFNQNLGLYAIHKASKPFRYGYKKAIQMMNLLPEQTAMVGDQIFTDILGGNRAGIFTILVKPIDPNEIWWVKLKRVPEKFILMKYEKRR